MVSTNRFLVFSFSLFSYFLILFDSIGGTSQSAREDHVCKRVETYSENIPIEVEEPITLKRYQWCVGFPPRCTYLTTVLRNRTKIQAIEKNRTVSECCSGFVEINSECVPECPTNQPCPNMKCPDTKHCFCLAGYTGLHCNTTCPVGRWGSNCSSKCQCGDTNGNKCHHLTGKCILSITTTTSTTAIPVSSTIITTTLPPSTKSDINIVDIPALTTNEKYDEITNAIKKQNTNQKLSPIFTIPNAIPDVLRKSEETINKVINKFEETIKFPNTPSTILPHNIQVPLTLPSITTENNHPNTFSVNSNQLNTLKTTEKTFYDDLKNKDILSIVNSIPISLNIPADNSPKSDKTPLVIETTHKPTVDSIPIGLTVPNVFGISTTIKPIWETDIHKELAPKLEQIPKTYETTTIPIWETDIINKEIGPKLEQTPKVYENITKPIWETDIINKEIAPKVEQTPKVYENITKPIWESDIINKEIATKLEQTPKIYETTTKPIWETEIINKEIAPKLEQIPKVFETTTQIPLINTNLMEKKISSIVDSIPKRFESINQSNSTSLETNNFLNEKIKNHPKYFEETSSSTVFDVNWIEKIKLSKSNVNSNQFENPTTQKILLNPEEVFSTVLDTFTNSVSSIPTVTTLSFSKTQNSFNPLTTPIDKKEGKDNLFIISSDINKSFKSVVSNVISKTNNSKEMFTTKLIEFDTKPSNVNFKLKDEISTNDKLSNANFETNKIYSTVQTKITDISEDQYTIPILQSNKNQFEHIISTTKIIPNFEAPIDLTPRNIQPPDGNLNSYPNIISTVGPDLLTTSNQPIELTFINTGRDLNGISISNSQSPQAIDNIKPITNIPSTSLSTFGIFSTVTTPKTTVQPIPNYDNVRPAAFNNNKIDSLVEAIDNPSVASTFANDIATIITEAEDTNPAEITNNIKELSTPMSIKTTYSSTLPSMRPTKYFTPPIQSPDVSKIIFSTTQSSNILTKPSLVYSNPPINSINTFKTSTYKPPQSTMKVVNPELDKAIGIFENSLNDLMKSMEHIGMKKTNSESKAKQYAIQNDGPRHGTEERINTMNDFNNLAAIREDQFNEKHSTSEGLNLIFIPDDDLTASKTKTNESLVNEGMVPISASILLFMVFGVLVIVSYVFHRRRKLLQKAHIEEIIHIRQDIAASGVIVERPPVDTFCKFINHHSMELMTELQETEYLSPPQPQPIYEEIRW